VTQITIFLIIHGSSVQRFTANRLGCSGQVEEAAGPAPACTWRPRDLGTDFDARKYLRLLSRDRKGGAVPVQEPADAAAGECWGTAPATAGELVQGEVIL